ncbi:MAG: endolytic transglycosylase MltG [Bacteroidaceae bacterium]|nr:endolytic transglycosylase MltG [Bacteroidaceae bacterium]
MKKKTIFKVLGGLALVLVILGGIAAYLIMSKPYKGAETAYIYIDNDDTKDSVLVKLETIGASTTGFKLLDKVKSYNVRTGKYAITADLSSWNLFRKLRNGQQEAVNMTVPSVRTLDRLAGAMTRNLMIDSLSVLNALQDSAYIAKLGYTPQTLPALIIPNTYQVFWDMSLDKLMERLVSENKKFWNEERIKKAEALKMTPIEVYTLASIVDEETANNAEKPMIAEMYLNRLEIGMPLQADPTIKVAVGDWSLRRILYEHLKVDSPYNTYIYTGLTPGPLRVASIAGIDAVLNHAEHDYLYMCAKEDFSGTHNFAVTYNEHLKNAKRYTDALNKRGIK